MATSQPPPRLGGNKSCAFAGAARFLPQVTQITQVRWSRDARGAYVASWPMTFAPPSVQAAPILQVQASIPHRCHDVGFLC